MSRAKELARLFTDTFLSFEPNIKWKKRTLKDIEDLLEHYNDTDIVETIKTFKEQYPDRKVYYVSDVFRKSRKTPTPSPDNLMKPDSFYYHDELRVVPPMPVEKVREDGSSYLHIEPFYLEMRESYTLEDLLTYFQRKMKTASIDKRKDIGALRYLVNSYGLDEVLFTIDHVWEDCTWNDKKLPDNPLELSNHMRKGIAELEHMKGQARLYGANKVIPRPV